MGPHTVIVVTIVVDFLAMLLPSQRENPALRARFHGGELVGLTLQH